MADNDLFRKYLDAGMAFTQITQRRAESIVKSLVEAGEVQREQAQAAVEDLVERSRRNTERLIDMVRKEVRTALAQRSLATKADVERLDQRIDRLQQGAPKASAGSAAGAKAPAKEPAARKGSAKKRAAAKKTAAKKKPAAKRSAS